MTARITRQRQHATTSNTPRSGHANSVCQVDPATQGPERVRDARYTLDHVFGPRQSTREIYRVTTQVGVVCVCACVCRGGGSSCAHDGCRPASEP